MQQDLEFGNNQFIPKKNAYQTDGKSLAVLLVNMQL